MICIGCGITSYCSSAKDLGDGIDAILCLAESEWQLRSTGICGTVLWNMATLACGHTWKVQQNTLENSRKKLMGFSNVKATKPCQRNIKPCISNTSFGIRIWSHTTPKYKCLIKKSNIRDAYIIKCECESFLNHWHHLNAKPLLLIEPQIIDLALKLTIPIHRDNTLHYFCIHRVVGDEIHFVLKCLLHNSSRDRFSWVWFRHSLNVFIVCIYESCWSCF